MCEQFCVLISKMDEAEPCGLTLSEAAARLGIDAGPIRDAWVARGRFDKEGFVLVPLTIDRGAATPDK